MAIKVKNIKKNNRLNQWHQITIKVVVKQSYVTMTIWYFDIERERDYHDSNLFFAVNIMLISKGV